MRFKGVVAVLAILLFISKAQAQNCPNLGQNPTSSFPVCGTATFVQTSVPQCTGQAIPGPCGAGLADINPFYYHFTCYVSGTLSFLITPNNLADDYDWQLFDVTGRNPNDIYTDATLFVACNWSGFSGVTGATSTGTGLINCAGNFPIFSSMPSILAGHDYLLLVSHFTNTQSGYKLSFTMGQAGEGTAAITDPANPVPSISSASPSCDATQVTIRFSKPLKCSSLAADGSDFTITPTATIISAAGYGCNSSFEMDSIVLTFSTPLAPGNYLVTAANGSDGNTVVDNCDRGVAVGDNANFIINPPSALAMGTITPPTCAPVVLTLNFTDPIKCNSIAADGSDFSVTGPSAVTISSATAVNCNGNGETNAINIQLSAPILTGGNYQVSAMTGSDGNTIIGPCNRRLTNGAVASFTVATQPPIAMGTVTPPPCIPTSLTLTFPDLINCNSISANGSDFVITGPSVVTVSSATAVNCDPNGQTNTITVQLSTAILVAGNYQVKVVNGSDGNTLVGQCGRQVTAGANTIFTLAPQPPLPMGAVAQPSCSPSSITINFTDPINCLSIAGNGSDFVISGPSPVTIISAGGSCNTSPTVVSITLQLSAPIVVSGTYQLRMANGADGNTLLGECNRQIAVGDFTTFTIPDSPPVPMGVLTPVACSPTSLRLTFASPIRCSSIAANGSDFTISGPFPVGISSAAGQCDPNGMTTIIDVQLASPIVDAGNYQLKLVNGSDGNTLLSDCNRPTPAGSFVSFTTSDTVSADFQYQVQYDCQTDLITFSHDGLHNVNQWVWRINGIPAGNLQTFTQSFSAESQNQVTLVVSNGVCSDSTTVPIVLNNKVTVDFEAPDIICPEDSVIFTNKSKGPIDNWQWAFGNGNTSALQIPPAQTYPTTGTETLYTVSLNAGNANGCQASATHTIKVLASCIIAVPSAFTPNNDGLNDYLYPLNALKAENLNFNIYNRWGQLVFHSSDWRQKWDGRINGVPQATSVYIWTLDYTLKDTKQKYSLKGTSTLIR